MHHRIPPQFTANARHLRTNATEAERLLWRRLCQQRPRFTRQLVIAPYIVDFACRRAKLAVELDGNQHVDAAAKDAARTRSLEAQGWRVLRFWNGDVLTSPDGVAEAVISEARLCLAPTPGPPLQGGEWRPPHHAPLTPASAAHHLRVHTRKDRLS